MANLYDELKRQNGEANNTGGRGTKSMAAANIATFFIPGHTSLHPLDKQTVYSPNRYSPHF